MITVGGECGWRHGTCCWCCWSMAWCVMIVGMPCVLLPPLDVQSKCGSTAAMEAAGNGWTDCLTALIEGKADLDIQVRGVMTYGRVALLVNGLIDPLRRVPLDWSIEWCMGWG